MVQESGKKVLSLVQNNAGVSESYNRANNTNRPISLKLIS